MESPKIRISRCGTNEADSSTVLVLTWLLLFIYILHIPCDITKKFHISQYFASALLWSRFPRPGRPWYLSTAITFWSTPIDSSRWACHGSCVGICFVLGLLCCPVQFSVFKWQLPGPFFQRVWTVTVGIKAWMQTSPNIQRRAVYLGHILGGEVGSASIPDQYNPSLFHATTWDVLSCRSSQSLLRFPSDIQQSLSISWKEALSVVNASQRN